ncbi:MAG: site-specific integrase [Roseiflexaceae bacterium]|nr:site-specific integrase [Roseiflexaceae bacterium]
MDETTLTVLSTPAVTTLAHVEALRERVRERARDLAAKSRADATKDAYVSDWTHFETWCCLFDYASLPAEPETVALYLAEFADESPDWPAFTLWCVAQGKRADVTDNDLLAAFRQAKQMNTGFLHPALKVATLTRRLAAISQFHQLQNFDSPSQSEIVRTVMKGIRREKGTKQNQPAPATLDVIRSMIQAAPSTLTGRRDRALLLVGFAGALRRSNIVALDVDHIRFLAGGMILLLGRSKTDQEGRGTEIGIAIGQHEETCPVRAVRTWLRAAEITTGPVFRPMTKHGTVRKSRLSDQSVGLIMKRYAAQVPGLEVNDFSAHSLRAGLPTTAAGLGVSDRAIAEQTQHRSIDMLNRYIRAGQLLSDKNVTRHIGL